MQKEQELLKIKQEIELFYEKKKVIQAREDEKNQAINSLTRTLNNHFKEKSNANNVNDHGTRIATLRNRTTTVQENKTTKFDAQKTATHKAEASAVTVAKENSKSPPNHCYNRRTSEIDASRIRMNESDMIGDVLEEQRSTNNQNNKTSVRPANNKASSSTYAEATKPINPTKSKGETSRRANETTSGQQGLNAEQPHTINNISSRPQAMTPN